MTATTARYGDKAFLGHPRALGYLAFTEAWERFSYYGMQSLLVLYMTKTLLFSPHVEQIAGYAVFHDLIQFVYRPGPSEQAVASAIFGLYTSLVYLTPILGGVIADRLLGKTRTIILGGLLMAAGHFLMAFDATFLLALLCLVLGTGAFKGNIAGQVGSLYAEGDLRRADAFQIFYLGINAGVIAAPLIAGTLGEKVGWHYGFGVAGVGMLIALVIYMMGRRHLPPDPPIRRKDPNAPPPPPLRAHEWRTIMLLVALIPVLTASVLCNQQIFNAYLVWADRGVDLNFMGEKVPTTWLITLDSVVSVTFLAGMVVFWRLWAKRFKEPDEIGKLTIGAFISVSGVLCLAAGAIIAEQTGAKVSIWWCVLFHVLNSIAFANMLPVSLALYARAAPVALGSTIIGVYYLHLFLGNQTVGILGTFLERMPASQFWLMHAGIAAGAALVFLVVGRFFSRLLSHEAVGGPARV
ncbi:MAG: peptide MFS transporter [Phenylobacterium sp.]|uniref:peptide MFS transporter n=1 Tax=Phenylobacterium sp. TaxID=1871053 RepID=UPI001A37F502|nr:peptide MFS transporter [Phenylobacterium sp.]MBL8772341.1 peptide MFS transporter [Phenylobacterium sp.]